MRYTVETVIRAGSLDRRITLERESSTVTPSGGVMKAWTPLATVSAELVRRKADEIPTGFGEAENGTVQFRIRYFPGLTTADRIAYDGKFFGIKEITEIGRRRGLEIRAVANK